MASDMAFEDLRIGEYGRDLETGVVYKYLGGGEYLNLATGNRCVGGESRRCEPCDAPISKEAENP